MAVDKMPHHRRLGKGGEVVYKVNDRSSQGKDIRLDVAGRARRSCCRRHSCKNQTIMFLKVVVAAAASSKLWKIN
jgi:hypothetical protein